MRSNIGVARRFGASADRCRPSVRAHVRQIKSDTPSTTRMRFDCLEMAIKIASAVFASDVFSPPTIEAHIGNFIMINCKILMSNI